MKKVVIMFVLLMSLCLIGNALAAGPEDECIAKSKEAVQLIAEKGLDAAITEINKKDGRFVSENTFVILFNFSGVVLAHPLKPETIGKSRLEDKDSKGKAYYKEYIEVAKTEGSGWVEHMWTSPDKKEYPKKTYILRVKGKDLAVAAGYIVK